MPTDAAALGTIRAVIFGFVLCQILLTDFSDFGSLPVTVLRPTGAMQVIPWRFYDALMTSAGMLVFKGLLVASLMAATAGFLTGISTKSSALLFLFWEGLVRSFGLFNHDEMPMVYILVVLAFTPCGEAFSLDRFFGHRQPKTGNIVYGYPILLMRALLAWSYFSSALIKMRVAGLSYFSSDSLPTQAIFHSLDNLHPTQFRLAFWLPQVRGWTTVAVIVVLLWEFTFPLAIFFKTARRIILVFGVLFHISTLLFMNIFFPYHLAAYAIFIDWPRLFARIKSSRPMQRLFGPSLPQTESRPS